MTKKLINMNGVTSESLQKTASKISLADFLFSLNNPQQNIHFQKYFPPSDSFDLLSRLNRTESINDAQNIAEQLKLSDNIKTGKLPCFVIKPLFKAVFEILMQFPHIKSGFSFLGSMSELLLHLKTIRNVTHLEIDKIRNCVLTAMTTMKIRAMAFQVGHTIGIAINDKIYADRINTARDKTSLLSEASNGIFPKSCNTVKSVIDHEIGHILDFMLGISSSQTLLTFIDKISLQEIKKELGTYAVSDYSNKRELIAVAYADKQNSKSPYYLSQKIYSLIENAYQKRFAG